MPGFNHRVAVALVPIPAADRTLNVLVFSPTPTHPAIQGNRQRVFEMCRAMQSMGAKVTFLYYAREAITANSAREMRAAWGEMEVIFPRSLVNRHSLVRYPAIDDWYDDDITAAALRLCSQKQFDICVLNYVWYSKLLKALPENVVRVIDTHDVFGGRAEKFVDIGLDPAWFHTSVEQEAIGLDRADFVVAIQEDEAKTLRARTRSKVWTVGCLSPGDFLPLRDKVPTERLSVGYVASGNPFNVASILALVEAARERPEMWAKVEIHIAGPVCEQLAAVAHPFRLRGVVESISEFYRSIDVAINPMLGGTGLKIKSLEALGFGKPLVATADAMTGIATNHPGHLLAGSSALLNYLVQLAENGSTQLAVEAAISRQIYSAYQKIQVHTFLELWSEIIAIRDAGEEVAAVKWSVGQAAHDKS